MSRTGAFTLAALLVFAACLGASEQEELEEEVSLLEALSGGTPHVNLRLRYEGVDDAGFGDNAHALTLRSALGYRTLTYKHLSVFLEAQNVTHLGNDLFNNRGAAHLANDVRNRPVVADPDLTRMQQVYLRVNALDTAVDLGRRQIAYGDHRFVGDIGWRQNFQTFDAVFLANRSIENTTLSYTFADKVLRIFGDEKDMSSHFLNGLVKLRDDVSLELFGYLLDYDAVEDAGLSSQSYGAKLFGAPGSGEPLRFPFEIQYAKQKDFANRPDSFDADYLHLVGGLGLRDLVSVKVGRELLGSAGGGAAFQTPLATGHKFNGWADLFLVTPPNGLVDWYVSVGGRVRTAAWILAYHDFAAEQGGASYGRELDAQLVYPTRWKQTFGAKLAFYREDGFARDVSKFWIWTQYAF